MAEKIIDVSSHQGANVDFNKVKASGITGVIIRAGFTGYGSSHTKNKDNYFESNYSKAKDAGLNVGAYYYSCAMSESAAVEEANYFLSLIKGKKFELPVYMDVEEEHSTSNMPALGKTRLTAIVKKWCETVENAGYFTGFYTAKSWCDVYLDMSILSRFTFWLAHWTSKTNYTGKYGIWQYSATGSVPGIFGNVDMSYMYEDFPSVIKSAGLNGFEKSKTDTETGVIYRVLAGAFKDKKNAEQLASDLKADGYKDVIVTTQVPGDVDGDGKVTSEDARIVNRMMVGLDKEYSLTDD